MAVTRSGDGLELLRSRRSRPRLTAPAPSRAELTEMLRVAGTAPDHGRLRPWRWIVLETAALAQLGDAYAAALAERDPAADDTQLARARGKPLRAPLVVVAVATPRPHPTIPAWEQRAAAICAAYGLVLAADATGYGAMWRSGWFGEAPKVRAHLGIENSEEVVGWIYLGTPTGPAPAPRPDVEPSVTWLG